MDNFIPQIVSVVFVIAGFGLLYSSYCTYKNFRLIKDIPRSTIRSMAMGIVELHGRVKAAKLLVSPFSKEECVYFKYTIEELRTTGSGKNRSTKWVTIKRDERYLPFFALDDTGQVLVMPGGADFNIELKHEYRQRSGLFGGFKRILDSITNLGEQDEDALPDITRYNLEEVDRGKFLKIYSTGDRRYREYYLMPESRLFVIGTAARDTNEHERVIIRKGNNNPTFIIADKDEAGILKSLKKGMIIKAFLSIVCVVLGLVVFLKINGHL